MTKRSVTIAGHRTSVSIEDPFWRGLAEIAVARRSSVPALISAIDRERAAGTNLSTALRLFVLDWYRAQKRPAVTADRGVTARER